MSMMPKVNMLHTLLRALPPAPLMYDIGANTGGYTHEMHEAHPDGFIHAFEPMEEFTKPLMHRFGGNPQIAIWPCGIADRCYTEEGLQVHEAWTLDRPERAKKGLNALWGGPVRTVSFVSVDTFQEAAYAAAIALNTGAPFPHEPVAFLKIDTDGYEYRVLVGATHTILRDRPLIYIELSYMPADLGDDIHTYLDLIYDTLNYRLVLQSGQIWHTAAQAWDHYPWHTSFDVMMIPAERMGTFPWVLEEERR